MKVNLSKNYSNSEIEIINNIIKAIFSVKVTDISSYSPSRELFISNSESDSADFTLDVNKFLASNTAFKGITFKNLANVIFKEYVDPRDISNAYNNISGSTKNDDLLKEKSIITNNSSTDIKTSQDEVSSTPVDTTASASVKKSFFRGSINSGIKS